MNKATIIICLLVALATTTSPVFAGERWHEIKKSSGSNGGKIGFWLQKGTQVKIELVTTPIKKGGASLRINLSKKHTRTDSYQIIATILKTNVALKKTLTANLKAGTYQLYLPVKNMEYTIVISRRY